MSWEMGGVVDHATVEALTILGQVVLINVVLSGDNAIVVGLAVTGLPQEQRLKALWLGIGAATLLRLAFALVATTLLRILGLLLAGGLLLLWVAWKLWRELSAEEAADAERAAHKSFAGALWQIIIADVSMSLDNALAVAGAAFGHPLLLAIGLVISVLLMGCAAALLASLLLRHRWIAYLGLLVILYVAAKMIWAGA
ncbi:MAG TPA: YjbE family putative metal transport protein, partial [Stellaceae bacterium]|nr:YjbE family putative metal transport protein [Stellaceae bacterium]